MKKMFASLGMVVSLLLGGAVAASPAQAEMVPVVQTAPQASAKMPAPPQEYEFEMRRNGTEQRVIADAIAADKRANAGTKGKGPTPLPPVPPSRAQQASCGSPSQCYEYNGFDQDFTADPGDDSLATMTIGKPYVDNSVLSGAHSLGEVAVVSDSVTDNEGDKVEFGWIVDKVRRADGNPTLWAGHWINNVFKGYDVAWVDYAPNPINLGAGLPKPADKQFGINQTSTAFWVFYDGAYVAYVPKSRWTPGGVAQPFNATVADFYRVIWFYESASHETETCNDLGTGTLYSTGGTPTPQVGAFSGYSVGATTITPNWNIVGTTPVIPAWGTSKTSGTTGKAGGPGYNSAGTAAGTLNAC